MTSTAQPALAERNDRRTIVGGGVKLGLITTAGVVVFALLSRVMTGTAEVVVQSLLILAGGVLVSYLPGQWVRAQTADGIAWAALSGLLGALTFTVIDTAVLRPLSLYHWTWDQIGGGSGFWYIPVWWMASTLLAWLGSLLLARRAASSPAGLPRVGGLTIGIAVVLFVLLQVVFAAPFHASFMGLAFAVALVLQVLVAAVFRLQ